jgi:hypothetical protein
MPEQDSGGVGTIQGIPVSIYPRQALIKTLSSISTDQDISISRDKVHTNETQELAKKVYDLSDPEAAKIPADDMVPAATVGRGYGSGCSSSGRVEA